MGGFEELKMYNVKKKRVKGQEKEGPESGGGFGPRIEDIV